jgi:hypothetical protein
MSFFDLGTFGIRFHHFQLVSNDRTAVLIKKGIVRKTFQDLKLSLEMFFICRHNVLPLPEQRLLPRHRKCHK